MFGPLDPTRKSTSQDTAKTAGSNNSVQIGKAEKAKVSSTHANIDDLFGEDLFSHRTTFGKKPSSDLFAFSDDDDLFSSSAKQAPRKSNAASSLFDNNDDDLFSIELTSSKKKSSFSPSSLFDDDDDLFLSTPQKEPSKTKSKKNSYT